MITCNWPDFTKRTAGTENSSLLSPQAIQFNCPGCTLGSQASLTRSLNQGNPIKLGQTQMRLPEPVGAPLMGAHSVGYSWRPNLDPGCPVPRTPPRPLRTKKVSKSLLGAPPAAQRPAKGVLCAPFAALRRLKRLLRSFKHTPPPGALRRPLGVKVFPAASGTLCPSMRGDNPPAPSPTPAASKSRLPQSPSAPPPTASGSPRPPPTTIPSGLTTISCGTLAPPSSRANISIKLAQQRRPWIVSCLNRLCSLARLARLPWGCPRPPNAELRARSPLVASREYGQILVASAHREACSHV